MVEGRDDSLIARPERGPDRPANVKGERRHVGAERDLVGPGRTEHLGHRDMGVVGDGVAPFARCEGATRVRIR